MSESCATVNISAAAPNKLSDNNIRNTKYTVYSFFPLVVYQHFHSVSSVFFFGIMILQIKRSFAISSFTASFVPWLFVLILSLVNEGVDDYKRYVRDEESNSAQYQRWTETGYQKVTSANIKAGDVILVKKGERIPADCIILKVDDATGEVFIRTDQLDGETDWKRRVAPVELQSCSLSSLRSIHLIAESPHKDIYSFTANLDMIDEGIYDNSDIFVKEQQKEHASETSQIKNEEDKGEPNLIPQPPKRVSVPLDLENTAWANTVVATSDVLGMVVYTGKDTRSMMNTYKPRSKVGKLEHEVDRVIFYLGLLSAAAAIIFTFMCATDLSFPILVIFVRYVMLFSYVIPISLKVTINLARIWYVIQIQSHPELTGVIVRTSSIQEELGRVSYILTDKTGTLTRNEMVMKKLHLGTICYAAENTEEITSMIEKTISKLSTQKSSFRKSKHLGMRVYELVEALSLCHGVMPVETEGGVIYQASSPDEMAIVQYADSIGFKLVKRDRVRIVIRTPAGDAVYKILQTFPFNSDTKRMGIIVEKQSSGEIFFFEKGADTAMKPILKENDWAEEETDNMARDGLRTLLIGKREMSQKEYKEFEERYNAAKLTLTGRAESMLEQQIGIERELDILGLTGVEDRLQDNVRQSLENLRNSGMRVWMLTGDKIETAISIALSSRLLNKSDHYLVISGCKIQKEMEQHLRVLKSKRYNALVIDGQSLVLVIEKFLSEFIETAQSLSCVVGCRYTPMQKATMAAALRERAGETVCCVGDGGNDVSMITEADVGIGIEGKEGNQASLAADFSVKNFADICDLFFWHGRRCYQNTSAVAHIIIHRGSIISIIQSIFSVLISFMPVSLFQGKMFAIFVFCTFFPLFAIINSSDISRNTALKFPELYRELRRANLLSGYSFLVYHFNSLYQGAAIMFLFCRYLTEIISLRMLSFTALIITEQLMVLFTLERITPVALLMCFLSLACYVIFIFIFDELDQYALSGWVLYIITVCFAATILPLCWWIFRHWIKPSSHRKLGLPAN